MKIIIEVIPHKSQRYPTVGDYWEEGDTLHVKISDMDNWKYQILVAIHELIEFHLCKDRGIDEPLIAEFDRQFEKLREAGAFDADAEPGNHPNAPYRKEHQFATFIEMMIARELTVNWAEYSKVVESL